MIDRLQEVFNRTRVTKFGSSSADTFFEEACIDGDGTMVTTIGECKQGMDINHQKRVGPFLGIWASVDDLAGQYGRTAVPSSIEAATVPATKGLPNTSTARCGFVVEPVFAKSVWEATPISRRQRNSVAGTTTKWRLCSDSMRCPTSMN